LSSIILMNPDNRRIVDSALPGYMLDLVMQSLAARGIEVRKDLSQFAKQAQARVFAQVPTLQRAFMAKIVEEEGRAILAAASPDKLTELLAGLCKWIVVLIAKNVEFDMDVMSSAATIAYEVDEDGTDWGRPSEHGRIMDALDNEAHKRGWLRPQDDTKIIV
jgi:hypothetical protein